MTDSRADYAHEAWERLAEIMLQEAIVLFLLPILFIYAVLRSFLTLFCRVLNHNFVFLIVNEGFLLQFPQRVATFGDFGRLH